MAAAVDAGGRPRVSDPPADHADAEAGAEYGGFDIGGGDDGGAAAGGDAVAGADGDAHDANADAGADAGGAVDDAGDAGDGGAADGGAAADVGAGGGGVGGDDDDDPALAGDEHLQVHANDQNKQLDLNIRQKEKLLDRHKVALDEHNERIGIMVDHLKNVEDEHAHTQALVDAKNKEIQTETHLGKIAEREAARLTTEITSYNKDCASIGDRINAINNAKFEAKNKEEKFQAQMNWSQEELLQWSLARKQKAEDAEAVAKYHKVDDAKQKALTLKLERKAREVVELKQQLDAESTETQATQIELDKAADEYRKTHLERQDTIRQWDEAMRAINKRNDAIGQVSTELANVKATVRAKSDETYALSSELEQKRSANTQAQVAIQAQERTIEKKRTQLTSDKKAVHDFEDEVGAQKSEHNKAESELNTAKAAIANLTKEREQRSRELEEAQLTLEHTKAQLDAEFKQTDLVADQAKQIDALLATKTAQDAAINKRLEVLKESMFKASHELFTLRKQEADLIAEISGAQGTSRNLQARIHELDQRSLKQQEMLYNIEFQVQQLERKVAFASGKRSLEETLALNQRIEELKGILEQHSGQHAMLGGQVKKLHDELRVARRKYNDACKQREELTERMVAIDVENESVGLEVGKIIGKKEALIVAHDTLKLEVKKLRDVLNARADQVFALENRKLGLELSMKEKEKEIALHREVQKAQVKAAEEARHMLAMDLKERLIKVEKLRSKYETIAAKLQKEDEDKSQAYYIIKAAQEREELQKEGDTLNLTIRHTEKEIRGLTRILKTLNARNTTVRESLQKADADGPLAKLHADLNTQTRTIADAVQKKKVALREVSVDYEHRRQTLAQLIASIAAIQKELDDRKKELLTVRAASAEQDAAIKRAEVIMLAKREEYRKKAGLLTDADHSPEELYMALEEQRKKNGVFMKLIRDFATRNGLESYCNDVLEAVGLESISRPMSAASSNGGGATGGSARGGGDVKTQPPVGSAGGSAVPIRAMDFKSAASGSAGASPGRAVGGGAGGKSRPVVARPLSRDNRPPSAGAPKLPALTGVSVSGSSAMSPAAPSGSAAGALPKRGTTPPGKQGGAPATPKGAKIIGVGSGSGSGSAGSRPGSAKKINL